MILCDVFFFCCFKKKEPPPLEGSRHWDVIIIAMVIPSDVYIYIFHVSGDRGAMYFAGFYFEQLALGNLDGDLFCALKKLESIFCLNGRAQPKRGR